MKKRKVIEAKTVKDYPQRNVFTTIRDRNEKSALKLHVTKFQKRSFQIIFSKTYLFGNTVSFKKSCCEIKF